MKIKAYSAINHYYSYESMWRGLKIIICDRNIIKILLENTNFMLVHLSIYFIWMTFKLPKLIHIQ